jgi:hypothetical protein
MPDKLHQQLPELQSIAKFQPFFLHLYTPEQTDMIQNEALNRLGQYSTSMIRQFFALTYPLRKDISSMEVING